ncbi:acetyl-CoA carboxylase biotin carboxyl carrier protein subunit [Leptolyngbya valderiana BDU 20041]|nr:acetyl-CoA carboxylase biotin carboxyl carrier protein [Geitlerinema sp. CS-897]OAB63048.1 acetyl-CoA carboxylase biotin carboxyl carrier protein subunit [Leptolyngbya valderiana BDU 20041]PPT08681.1 Biotin carboxyl carrier protein of acetyl-CoA carboxylase [Geitlerinema sp. FC II]
MQLDFNQLRELLADLDKTDIAELTLKSSDLELTVRKTRGGLVETASSIDLSALAAATGGQMPTAPTPVPPANPSNGAEAASPPPPSSEPKWVEIVSPMVGTFYRAPAPDEPPFVEVGDRITTGRTVCIIEAMKLMNEVESEVAGEVVEILVENGEPVEYDQPLMRILPA